MNDHTEQQDHYYSGLKGDSPQKRYIYPNPGGLNVSLTGKTVFEDAI